MYRCRLTLLLTLRNSRRQSLVCYQEWKTFDVPRLGSKLMTVGAVLASLVPILRESGIGFDFRKLIAAPIVHTSISDVFVVDCISVCIHANHALPG
jgi:Cu/Ag efflux pump CusA